MRPNVRVAYFKVPKKEPSNREPLNNYEETNAYLKKQPPNKNKEPLPNYKE